MHRAPVEAALGAVRVVHGGEDVGVRPQLAHGEEHALGPAQVEQEVVNQRDARASPIGHARILCTGALRSAIPGEQLAGELDQSSQLLDRGLAARGSSPSQGAARREQAVLLAEALGKLPDDYREVIILRHLESLTFPQVAQRMGRSLDSVEKLWLRALARLRQLLGGPS